MSGFVIPPVLVVDADNKKDEHRYYPSFPRRELVVEVSMETPRFHAGFRGRVRSGYGTSLYNWHGHEIPVEGTGAPRDALLVVELATDGSEVKTPYVEWCRRYGLKVVCNRCRQDLLGEKPLPKCRGRQFDE